MTTELRSNINYIKATVELNGQKFVNIDVKVVTFYEPAKKWIVGGGAVKKAKPKIRGTTLQINVDI